MRAHKQSVGAHKQFTTEVHTLFSPYIILYTFITSASTPEWALMPMPSPFLMSQTSQFLTWQDCCLRNIGSHPAHARLKTLRPRQNGRHFADNIFKCIFLNANYCIILLKCFSKCPIDNKSALVQVMAWCLIIRHQANTWTNADEFTWRYMEFLAAVS